MLQRLTYLLVVLTVLAMSGRAENWPGFRGPTGQGMSSEKGLPAEKRSAIPARRRPRSPTASSGDGIVAALTTTGDIVWTNRDFKYYSQHGLGVSPRLYQDLLIIPFDWSSEGEDKKVGWQKPWDKSVILAFDKRTGKLRWRAQRGLSRLGHVTPDILREKGNEQLISAAGDVIQGFDPNNGEKLWWVRSQGEGVVPSVVIGDGLIFTASGFEQPTIRAVRTKARVM